MNDGKTRRAKNYTQAEREQIVDKYIDLLESRIDDCITDLAIEAGAKYRTIDGWEDEYPEFRVKINSARKVRAWKYITKSLHVLRDCDPFYNTEKFGIKDSNALVNLAKFRSDAYKNVAGFLVPEVFGNYAHELKSLSKEIKELQKLLVKDAVSNQSA